jgi:hypothetical protein
LVRRTAEVTARPRPGLQDAVALPSRTLSVQIFFILPEYLMTYRLQNAYTEVTRYCFLSSDLFSAIREEINHRELSNFVHR